MSKKFLITALMFGLPWSGSMLIYYSIIQIELTSSVIITVTGIGIACGFTFALVIQYLGKKMLSGISIEIDPDETIVKEGGANLFRGKEGVGGKLVLTTRRLIFKPHKLNIQNYPGEFNLLQIEKLLIAKTLGVLENKLTLELANSGKYQFVIDSPADWREFILKQKAAL